MLFLEPYQECFIYYPMVIGMIGQMSKNDPADVCDNLYHYTDFPWKAVLED